MLSGKAVSDAEHGRYKNEFGLYGKHRIHKLLMHVCKSLTFYHCVSGKGYADTFTGSRADFCPSFVSITDPFL